MTPVPTVTPPARGCDHDLPESLEPADPRARPPKCECGLRSVRQLVHVETGQERWVRHRGKTKRCPLCGPLWLTDAAERIAATATDDVLYVATVTRAQWPTIRDRIGDRGNGAAVAAVDITKIVLTNDNSIAGARRLPRADAIDEYNRVALAATMHRSNARVDFCGTWRTTPPVTPSSTQAEASASVRSAEGDPSTTTRDANPDDALRPRQRTTPRSPWCEVRSTPARPAFIAIAAREVGGRFVPRDGAWRLEGVPRHLLPDFYARIGALTPEERTQRRDEARARADLDAMTRRHRAWSTAA